MNNRRSPSPNLLLSIAMAAVCAIAAFQAARWALAEYYRYQVLDFIEQARAEPTLSIEAWTAAKADMDRAIALNAAPADFHFFQGFMYELRLKAPYPVAAGLPEAARQTATLEFMAADLQRAIADYRQALARGPSMADSWIRLAKVKQVLGQFDPEFVAAYGNAMIFARNLAGLQPELSDLSLGFFAQIQNDDNLRPLQLAHLVKVMTQGDPGTHIDLMKQYGVLAAVCAVVEAETTLPERAARACSEADAA